MLVREGNIKFGLKVRTRVGVDGHTLRQRKL